ncbi:M28 family peptidase [Massilia sp. CF038]|uniref:M28 family peptidase n=1 Tax=Massilia sp. CF038 TaxID=1881045 RepID=UPI0009196921|nr:M28 family peptidase [Massilia sp. CF038]SHG53483.1 Zn-dependent amino-or carboxypeptidase, M28 family [Massilia sp. CF038]
MRTRTAVLLTTGLIWLLGAGALALVVQPLAGTVASTPPAVDPARLEQHVRHLSQTLYPRSADQPGHLNAAAHYIAAEFRAAGASVEMQPVLVQGQTYHNVIARFGPRQGALLVIGAHYDSHGANTAAVATADSHTPGADDNASGVAGLIELAQLLGRQAPARPIELVAYTLEEPPHFRTEHMGSAWHARALKASGRAVQLMLSLEMIGYFSDAPGSQSYPVPAMKRLYPERGNFIALVGRFGDFGATRRAKAIMAGATDLPVESLNAPPVVQGIDFSDHRNYWHQGYPALMVTDTAFMRNPNYHKAGDTADTLDYVRAAKVVQSVFALTSQL